MTTNVNKKNEDDWESRLCALEDEVRTLSVENAELKKLIGSKEFKLIYDVGGGKMVKKERKHEEDIDDLKLKLSKMDPKIIDLGENIIQNINRCTFHIKGKLEEGVYKIYTEK